MYGCCGLRRVVGVVGVCWFAWAWLCEDASAVARNGECVGGRGSLWLMVAFERCNWVGLVVSVGFFCDFGGFGI